MNFKLFIFCTTCISMLALSSCQHDIFVPVSDTDDFTKTGFIHCSTDEYNAQLIANDPAYRENRQRIEELTTQFVANYNPSSSFRTVKTIPVVVHVVYNTASQNIPLSQIQNQIAVLNADYSKSNSDITKVPAIFQSIESNMEVQFSLFSVDRVSTTTTSFTTDDRVKSSSTGGANSIDPAHKLNIWLCNLGGGLLGYSTFPGGIASNDGVVILYSSLPGGTAAPYNLGRTATHEIGHWLNLYHTFQGGCARSATTGGDLVADTPSEKSAAFGCPTNRNTCNSGTGDQPDITVDYMDYTDDACMYMFTLGQKARAQAIFASGGPRASF